MASPSQSYNSESPTERISPKEKNHEGIQAYEASVNVYKNDISPAEVANFYTSWAADYDKDFHTSGLYLGPSFVADTLASLLTSNRDTVRVLDVASGTGILGEKLYEAGFRNIDGLDPSPGMLEICRSKNIYSDLICDFITEKPSTISTDTYDCLGICGGMGPGHIPRGALREMIRVVKPADVFRNGRPTQHFLVRAIGSEYEVSYPGALQAKGAFRPTTGTTRKQKPMASCMKFNQTQPSVQREAHFIVKK